MINGGLEKIESDDESRCDFKTFPKGCLSTKKTRFTKKAIHSWRDKKKMRKGEYESDDGGITPGPQSWGQEISFEDPFRIKTIWNVWFTNKKGDLNLKVIEVESYKKFNFIDQENHLCCAIF